MMKIFSDPSGWRININSFQQDAIVTYKRYQYAAGYNAQRRLVMGRRLLESHEWDLFEFDDYLQTRNDGHNIVSIGVSGDGVLHMSWDLHNDKINYRSSLGDIDSAEKFGQSLFSPISHDLSGISLTWVTYPRFVRLHSGDILLELRIGRSGLGDDYLYRYSCETKKWAPVGDYDGMYLKGIGCNAYINGIDSSPNGELHVSWTYRDFVEDGTDTSKESTVAVQAGPNGPENNHDLYYAYSTDEGITWYNTFNKKLEVPIKPGLETRVVEIPKFSGIMNQEGQVLDRDGFLHVLNREEGFYYHYWRLTRGDWARRKLPYRAIEFGERGQLCLHPTSPDLIALLPGNDGSTTFIILSFSAKDSYEEYKVVYEADGFDGEPLYDRYRQDGILSIVQRQKISESESWVCVLDFDENFNLC
ncbi:hypothetical protein TRVA0_001S06370 [Trichomonascus vanleenenianus]|uniref:BNR repeat-containing protein n=1 Tax=Trichomonascus vanleenenianus TaxID=2268995 RepID=UPI003ECAE3D6